MAIAENSQLGFVRRVREKLNAFPVIDELKSLLEIDGTCFNVVDETLYKAGDFIQIELEVMRVTSTEYSGCGVVYVLRAQKSTEAAIHASGLSIQNFGQLWSDDELKRIINDAIIALRPQIMYQVSDETVVITASTREYAIPASIVDVMKVEIEHSTDVYLRVQHAQIITKGSVKYLMFNYQPSAGKKVRITGLVYQVPFSDSVTALTLSDLYWDLIVTSATSMALETTLTNRARFTQYSASLNPRASTMDEIIRMIYFFNNQFRIGKSERAPRKVGYSFRARK